MLTILPLAGEAITPYLDALARLRIEVFREYPYLYDGDMAYEQRYLQAFLQAPDSFLVAVLDGAEVVGASTALPLEHESANIRQPMAEAGYEVEKVFYFGESVLRREYRGRGLGVRFFEERERRARQLGRFDTLAFCAVVRPEEHPLRPEGYRPLDEFWRRRGFALTDVFCFISWQEVGEEGETPKPLRFWMKTL
ncbi:MAG: GNAT family N-acetyltransferase [Lewinellaceae bacterium]|nr:GNAT family N-acetyltransferase [Phaeodactylibacter sp.]MCB9039521.1 GNAT family N-acetyltransferase [Lewinellaceae bacterium]